MYVLRGMGIRIHVVQTVYELCQGHRQHAWVRGGWTVGGGVKMSLKKFYAMSFFVCKSLVLFKSYELSNFGKM